MTVCKKAVCSKVIAGIESGGSLWEGGVHVCSRRQQLQQQPARSSSEVVVVLLMPSISAFLRTSSSSHTGNRGCFRPFSCYSWCPCPITCMVGQVVQQQQHQQEKGQVGSKFQARQIHVKM